MNAVGREIRTHRGSTYAPVATAWFEIGIDLIIFQLRSSQQPAGVTSILGPSTPVDPVLSSGIEYRLSAHEGKRRVSAAWDIRKTHSPAVMPPRYEFNPDRHIIIASCRHSNQIGAYPC